MAIALKDRQCRTLAKMTGAIEHPATDRIHCPTRKRQGNWIIEIEIGIENDFFKSIYHGVFLI